jgi:RHS repeat-associated protein
MGAVTHTPLASGASCSDGNACTTNDVCNEAGVCSGTPVALDDGNPCTADTCDPLIGERHDPVPVGASCSDANYCNGTETCDGLGTCLAGIPVSADDRNPCTVDRCDPATGVWNDPVPGGTSCSDGDACNGEEICNAQAVCAASAPPEMDDDDPCTADSCDPIFGVTHELIAACAATLPDPAAIAPPLSRTSVTSFADAVAFLYTGVNRIQFGVASGAILPERASVVRGTVQTADGAPISGVQVSIPGHPAFGHTYTRVDGTFDLAVNGGGVLVAEFQKTGFLPVQRNVAAPWQDFAWLRDVIMIPPDSRVTAIASMASQTQVARGSPVTDASGTRQATVFFPAGTNAGMKLRDGTSIPLQTLNVRMTEYTATPRGASAMPGDLPPTSGFTYAVELGVDEAVAVNATDVWFTEPVKLYLENHLRFPVGGRVPTGYYDRAKGAWVASQDGRIVKVLAVSGGFAALDVDGSGTPADATKLAALGVTTEELGQIAQLYSSGQELWRVQVAHFSSWDCNWPTGCGTTCAAPDPTQPPPPNADPCGSTQSGSKIECQNQVLGEEVPIVGTPFRLHYQSDRMPGNLVEMTRTIRLTGDSAPSDLLGIELSVRIAGQVVREVLSPPFVPNQTYSFTWDGKDAYGREYSGKALLEAEVAYVFQSVYLEPSDRSGDRSFGSLSSTGVRYTASRTPGEPYRVYRTYTIPLGRWQNDVAGLGGWSITPHHAYDPATGIVYIGNGSRRSVSPVTNMIISSITGGVSGNSATAEGIPAIRSWLYYPESVAVAPDGSVFVTESHAKRVRRIDRDRIIRTYAGRYGGCIEVGEGGPALDACISPTGVAIAEDGTLYVAEYERHQVRKVTPDGRLFTVAGTGVQGFSGDGGPALEAQLNRPSAVAVGRDGSLVIGEYLGRIRRIDANGTISTLGGAGCGSPPKATGDGGPAVAARFCFDGEVDIGPDGTVYFTDTLNRRIRKIGPNGIIWTVAGSDAAVGTGDGGPAVQAGLGRTTGLALDRDGSLYLTEGYSYGSFTHSKVRKVRTDGTIVTVAGQGPWGLAGDEGPALEALLRSPSSIAIAPDGTLWLEDNLRIRMLGPPIPRELGGNVLIASASGDEVYAFDSEGRHIETIDSVTGIAWYTFAYDPGGRLTAITDRDGLATRIERNLDGSPFGIVAPHGQRTSLALDSNGFVSTITNPANERIQLAHSPSGMLSSLIDPKNGAHQFGYDPLGRLTSDANPAGGLKALARAEGTRGFSVTLESLVDTTSSLLWTYLVDEVGNGDLQTVDVAPDGTSVRTVRSEAGRTTRTLADGTSIVSSSGPDPRFGMGSPTRSMTLTTPAGLQMSTVQSRAVTLSNSRDVFSLTSLTETTTVNGRAMTRTYNASARTLRTTTAGGRTTALLLDEKGRVSRVEPPGYPSTYATDLRYDASGRLTTITQGARTTSVTYNTDGYPDTVTDPSLRVSRFLYDPAGRTSHVALPEARSVSFGYDWNGNLTSLAPPGRPSHGFTYEPMDRVATYDAPVVPGVATGTTGYGYNLHGDPTSVVHPDGNSVTATYGVDAASRPTGKLAAVSTWRGTAQMAYDVAGRLATLSAPGDVALTFGYDGFLRTSETWTGPVPGFVTFGYDNDFRIASVGVNGSPVAFQYDADGLVTQAGALSIAREPATGLVSGTTVGQVTTTQSYDAYGELRTFTANASGDIYSYTLQRDQAGRIVGKAETIGGTNTTYVYEYDDAGRLWKVTINGAVTAIYTYDANGNRLTGPLSQTGTYDDQDRMLSDGAATYTHGANGDLRTKTENGQTTTYAYDALGNLVAATLADGTQIEYIIDGLNRRVGKKVNGELAQGFLYEGQLRPAAWLDGAGNVYARFVYGTQVNVPEYMVTAAGTYRIVTDHLGSPRLVVDVSTGAVVQRMDFDEWGNVTFDSNPGLQPFGFAGGLYDRDTALVRFGARDYDPRAGRWTTKDPILFAGEDGNLYAYVGGDPVSLADPVGLWTVQLGLTLDLTFPNGFSLTGHAGFAIDGFGNFGGYWGGGLGAGVGTGATGGVQALVSNAPCIGALAGGGINIGAGGGWGPSAAGDAFFGPQSSAGARPVIGGGLTVGPGYGVTSFIGPVVTAVKPIGRIW